MPPKYYKKKRTIVSSHHKTTTDYEPDYSNAIYLLIVESPSKCKKIEEYLGEQYRCIASKGHLRFIDSLKSIDSDFSIQFSIIEEKQEHIKQMKEIIQTFHSSHILLATDDDREGEAIAWHICDIFHLPIETTKRILFHEITQTAIQKAIQNPTIINMNLVNAQKARQVLDMIVGYKISPLLWTKANNTLSAGRCQTPALRLIYENEKKQHELETKYKTSGFFFSLNIEFRLNHDFEKEEDLHLFLEQSKTYDSLFSMKMPKEMIQTSPIPLNTSHLLQLASNHLHYSPHETMSLCQRLYQNGDITYMRTDNTKYSKLFIEQIKPFIQKTWGEKYVSPEIGELVSDDNKNPHEAIRVIHLDKKHLDISDSRLCSLYHLIWKYTIQSCMSDAVYKTIQCHITAPMDLLYVYRIEIPIFLGWKGIEGEPPPSDNKQLFFQMVDKTKKVPVNYIESTVSAQYKNNHYTEASLIKKLEDLGIGRPSTFSSIVETIQERGYVIKQDILGETHACNEYVLRDGIIEKTRREKTFGKEKGKLVIQELGIQTIEFLLQFFHHVFSYEYTNQMENKLDEIETNPIIYKDVCNECLNEIRDILKEIRDLTKQVFPINDEYYLIFKKNGSPVLVSNVREGVSPSHYKSVKSDIKIDIEKLKAGLYTYDDLVEDNYLGQYEGEELFIKKGLHGYYAKWGENRVNIDNIGIHINKITIQDIIDYITTKKTPSEKNILRMLDGEHSIRRGPHGFYIYTFKNEWKKPRFVSLKKFKGDFLSIEPNVLIEWAEKNS
jgi:DNA topoisomerase-1